MARKRKGSNLRKNNNNVKVNKSKSGQSVSDNSSELIGESDINRRRASADSVVLMGVDELHSDTDRSDNYYSSVATDASGWTRSALVEGTRSGKMPRPWFTKWGWWFLPLSLVGGALCAWWGVRHIEGQVQTAAPEILQAAGVDPSGLTFDATYRNIAVAGQLPQSVTVDDVEQILEKSTGVNNEDIREATVTALAAPEPEPEPEPVPEPEPEPEPIVVEPTGEISVTAVSDGQTIRLTGSVPQQEHADRLFASAASAVGEGNVVNDLNVLGLKPSAPEPAAQIDRLSQVLPQLGSGISSANLALGDETFSGSIDALDTDAKSLLDPIVATTSKNDITVTAPIAEPEPLDVDVFANYQGQQIILYGEVISDAQSQTLFNAAAESVGADKVVSTLKVLRPGSEPSATDAQVALMGETLRQYGGLQSAESRLNASSLYLRGVANSEAAKQNVDQALQSGTDDSLSVVGDVTVLSIDSELSQLQAEFDLLSEEIRENVVFDTNSDLLNTRATEVLDKVVSAIGRFERPRVLVSGHTDSLGPAGANQVLSARRASAVRTYLAERGVDVERVRAVGLGEAQPIGDNNTAAGRQINRRVEFTAVERF